jgi:hypothetical protein
VLKFGVVIAYVAGSPSARHSEKLAGEFQAMLLPDIRKSFGIVSYERIGELAAAHDDSALAAFIEKRVRDGLAADYPRSYAR